MPLRTIEWAGNVGPFLDLWRYSAASMMPTTAARSPRWAIVILVSNASLVATVAIAGEGSSDVHHRCRPSSIQIRRSICICSWRQTR